MIPTILTSQPKNIQMGGCGFLGDNSLGGIVRLSSNVCPLRRHYKRSPTQLQTCRAEYHPQQNRLCATSRMCPQISSSTQSSVNSDPTMARLEVHQVCTSHHKAMSTPVPPVMQDDVSQIEVPPVGAAPPVATSPPAVVQVSNPDISKTKLISTMSHEDILQHMHHPSTTLPKVRLCDTRKASDKKTH